MSVALMPITARVERFMAKIIIWFGQSNNWQIAIDFERFSCFELHLNYKPIALVTSCCHEPLGEESVGSENFWFMNEARVEKFFLPFFASEHQAKQRRLSSQPRLFFGDENKIALIKYINAFASPPTHHLFRSSSFICRRHIKLSSWPYDVDRPALCDLHFSMSWWRWIFKNNSLLRIVAKTIRFYEKIHLDGDKREDCCESIINLRV